MVARLHCGMQYAIQINIKRAAVVVLGVLGCSILQCTAAAALTQADDAAVLLQFQQQYGFIAEGWAGDKPCGVTAGGEWSHVKCCQDQNLLQRVCELAVVGKNLAGPVPALVGLTELHVLDLSNNQLTGSDLPPGLARTALHTLRLANNQLQGDWQAGLDALCTNMTGLRVLDLSGNPGIEGVLPDCWGQLSQLTELTLSNTSLAGTLPSAWGNLQVLEHLDLSHTRWQPHPAPVFWPLEWGNMTGLRYLDLSDSNYTTIITVPLPATWLLGEPPYIGMDLTHFQCRNCSWSEAKSSSLQFMRNLQWLDISYNPGGLLTTLPPEWKVLPLVAVKARGCGLSSAMVSSDLFGWTFSENGIQEHLRVLDIGDNPALTDATIGDTMASLELWELYIDNTSLGSLTPGWDNLPCVLEYTGNPNYDPDLEGTPPVDTSTTGICRTNEMAEWELLAQWNAQSNLGLPSWDMGATTSAGFACPNSWQHVTCDNTTQRPTGINLSGVPLNCDAAVGGCHLLPDMFSGTGLTALHSLVLSNTSFTLDMDTFDFSGMFMLKVLDLRFMPNLVGTLNPSWGEWMPRMQEFYMAGALNVGNLPSEWVTSWSQNLTNLVISGCGMTGPVPPELEFTQVIRVDLSNNSLTGSFAPLANSSTLQALDLSNNQLSGSLLWLHDAPELRYARLSGNAGITGPLNGTTPEAPGGWSVLDHLSLVELEVANCGLSGPLPSPLYYANNGLNGNGSIGSPLRRLELQGNSLTGTIPQTWSNLQRLGCLQLHNNPGLCGDVPDGLPCFSTAGTSLGSSVAGCPLTNTTFTNGVSSVTCFPPAEGCFPFQQQGAPAPAPALNASTTSGWTADGRALQSIGVALGLQPGALSYPAPCLLSCGGMLPQGSTTAPYMPPVQGLCFQCDSYMGPNGYL